MRTKVFYGILVLLMGSLILFGKCRAWGGEVEEYYQESNEYQIVFDSGSVTVIPDDITALLRECLEYIQDGSVDQGVSLTTLVYCTVTRDGVAQDEAERCRRETALHKRIVEMIRKLEQK